MCMTSYLPVDVEHSPADCRPPSVSFYENIPSRLIDPPIVLPTTDISQILQPHNKCQLSEVVE